VTLAILTPSYRPDLEGLRRLHRSVLEHTDGDVVHHVIVPRADLELFGDLASSRLKLWSEADFLPPRFVLTDGFADVIRRFDFLPAKARVKAINSRRPWPPIRGWILQQIIKLQAATRIDADVLAVIDSDVVLIRDVARSTFVRDASVRLYRNPRGITAAMERHTKWEAASARLLGIPPTAEHADYIAGLITWDPALVAECLARVESVTGSGWASAVGSELHFSEFMLYGSFVHSLGTPEQNAFVSDRTLCHSYWEPFPLSMRDAIRFVDELPEDDVAVHVQSNSRTPADVQDFIFRAVGAS
jgi:hypothetical protein